MFTNFPPIRACRSVLIFSLQENVSLLYFNAENFYNFELLAGAQYEPSLLGNLRLVLLIPSLSLTYYTFASSFQKNFNSCLFKM
jgi:hypothetical protein